MARRTVVWIGSSSTNGWELSTTSLKDFVCDNDPPVHRNPESKVPCIVGVTRVEPIPLSATLFHSSPGLPPVGMQVSAYEPHRSRYTSPSLRVAPEVTISSTAGMKFSARVGKRGASGRPACHAIDCGAGNRAGHDERSFGKEGQRPVPLHWARPPSTGRSWTSI